jgi:hypothetical protein
LSIFSKECPQCAATGPADASRCGCGYLFDPYLVDDAQRTLGLAVKEDEKLYEEYLAARAVQAAEAAKTEAAEQGAKSWRTKLAAQATKAAKGVARQQVRLAVKTIRAAPGAVATAKAARIRKAEAAPPVSGRHLTPSKKPGATFRAAQAAKAAKALRATLARETLECPCCTATVAASAVRCRCGHPLQSPKCEVPALGRDERAALAKDGHLKRPADKLSDSLIAIYTAADIPKVN